MKIEEHEDELTMACVSVHCKGIRAWNDIPNNIRELSSLCLFKIHLKRHFMSKEN